jgi:cobalt/nickel transport system permease protein
MADALVSPTVAGVAGIISIGLIVTATIKSRRERRDNSVALMGVMGAFIFAAQMLNFSIPGTGSSGHIVGGVLLATILGPWEAFLTLVSVLIIQCLVFADGGLMALGCNILNMGALTCLVAYPLIFKPIAGNKPTLKRVMIAAVAACVIGLELGALAVTIETKLSGITALPTGDFLLLMLPIHFLIGLGEGLATAAVLAFVMKSRPEILVFMNGKESNADANNKRTRSIVIVFAALALIFGVVISKYASSNPDGLEWSIQKLAGDTELTNTQDTYASTDTRQTARELQSKTAFMPDYENRFSGVVGAGIVVVLAAGISLLCRKHISQKRYNTDL